MRTTEDISLLTGVRRATHYAVARYSDHMTDGVVPSTVVSVHAWDDGRYVQHAAEAARERSLCVCNVPEGTKAGDVLPLRPWWWW